MRLVQVLFCLLIIIFEGCSSYQPSAEDQASDKIITQVADHLEREYGMHLSALGGGADKGIWLITAHLHIYRALDQTEARYLIVKAVEKFLEEVNNSEDIRPYLKNYPFKPENLRIFIISFKSIKRERSLHPYIGGVYQDGGDVTYLTLDPEDVYKFKDRIEEPYTEAFKIIQEQENLK